MNGRSEGATRTDDGVDLRYRLRGRAGEASPRFVLVHSLALNEEVWASVAERLVKTSGAEVLTYDCRGHGGSMRAAGPYSLSLFAGDLATILDAAGWRSAIVAGVSMGGIVAQAFAVAYPERVEQLGLVDTTAWYGPDAVQRWSERARKAEEQGLQALVEFQLTRWFSDTFRAEHPEVGQHFAELFLANDVVSYAATCEMLGSFDLRDAIRQIRVPTAVAVGDEDYATPPAMANQIHEAIPDSTLELLPGARHLTPLERPDDIARILGGLAELRSGAAEARSAAHRVTSRPHA